MTKEQALEILSHPDAQEVPKEILMEAMAVLANISLTPPPVQQVEQQPEAPQPEPEAPPEPSQPRPWWKLW